MRKKSSRNPYVPLDTSQLFPHRAHPAFIALDELNHFIVRVLQSQTKEHDLDTLQEPLSELGELVIELASGGMSLRAWRRRFDDAQVLAHNAKKSLPSLLSANAMSGGEAFKISGGIDTVMQRLESHWRALQPEEPAHGDEAEDDTPRAG